MKIKIFINHGTHGIHWKRSVNFSIHRLRRWSQTRTDAEIQLTTHYQLFVASLSTVY